MENTRTLDQLAAGQLATVAAITAPEDRRRRLLSTAPALGRMR